MLEKTKCRARGTRNRGSGRQARVAPNPTESSSALHAEHRILHCSTLSLVNERLAKNFIVFLVRERSNVYPLVIVW